MFTTSSDSSHLFGILHPGDPGYDGYKDNWSNHHLYQFDESITQGFPRLKQLYLDSCLENSACHFLDVLEMANGTPIVSCLQILHLRMRFSLSAHAPGYERLFFENDDNERLSRVLYELSRSLVSLWIPVELHFLIKKGRIVKKLLQEAYIKAIQDSN